MTQQNIKTVAKATELMSKHNKKQLIEIARGMGWKGDHARAPAIQLALYIASNGDTEKKQGGGDDRYDSDNEKQNEEQEQEQEQQNGNESQQGQGNESQQSDSDSDNKQQSDSDNKQQSDSDSEKQEQSDSDSEKKEQEKKEKAEKEKERKASQKKDNDEWETMVTMLAEKRGEKPHPMLRKIHALTVKAKQNVMLVGASGAGKTMLCGQLAAILDYQFSFISCTSGMSESQLLGWLLPVGDNGKFTYVSAPFIQAYAGGNSVFLFDEMDGADSNTLLVLNSALANKQVSVPQSIDHPLYDRHETAYLIAACNAPNGADESYSARNAIDAATMDRFYPIAIDYSAQFEALQFDQQDNAPPEHGWHPATRAPDYIAAHEWFKALRAACVNRKIPRIVSTRMAMKIRAALDAGISFDEIKADLLLPWSADEKRRALGGI